MDDNKYKFNTPYNGYNTETSFEKPIFVSGIIMMSKNSDINQNGSFTYSFNRVHNPSNPVAAVV